MCSKHVEAWNKLIIKFSASSWLILGNVSGSSSVHHQDFFSLYTQQYYMSYRFANSLLASKAPDNGQRNCPKHREFYSQKQIWLISASSWFYYYKNVSRVSSWSCSQAVSKPVWHIPLLCVQWKTPDDGQRNCPKYVEFYSPPQKFWEISASSWFCNKNLSRCTVTLTSNRPQKFFFFFFPPRS